jgi:hypothetical protein
MKTKIFLFGMALAYIISSVLTGCGNKNSAQSFANAGDTLVLSLDSTTCVDWQTDIFLPVTDSTGYWDSTYTNNPLCFGEFVLDHVGGIYPGSSYAYWGGFTFGVNGDSLPHGISCPSGNCDSTHSVGWIKHQWGVMAGGGLNAANATVKGRPYLIAFGQGIDVSLKDSALFKPVGVYICNHPWPFWGNLYGDGFARPLKQKGDYFKLIISGLDNEGVEIGTRDYYLAQYDSTASDSVQQSKEWEWVDLSKLGKDGLIQIIRFEFESTDSDPTWGPNTAMYFCMDKLKVVKGESAASSTVAQKSSIKKTKEPLVRKREFTDYLTLNVHKGGEAIIQDATGKVVLKTMLKAGNNRVDTRKLSSGEYLLRIHHRTIHLIKK